MLFLTKKFKQSKNLSFFLLVIGVSTVMAQEPAPSADGAAPPPQIVLQKVIASLVDAPGGSDSYATASNPNFTNQWLKVEFTYTANPVSKSGFIDAAQFKIWIEGRDLFDPQAKDERGTVVAFTGTLNYVNIIRAQTASGVAYLSPATINRYATSRGVVDFTDHFEAYVEAYVSGKLNSAAHKNTSEPVPTWFPQVKAMPNLVYNQGQSPFLLTDINKYPPLALPATP